MEAGLVAPSSKGKMPWQFVVVDDKQKLAALSQCKDFGAKPIAGCALAIVVVVDPYESDVWIEDASIASIYMQLQAEDLGLGSCWCQIRNRQREDDTDAGEYVRNLLHIPYQLEVLSIIGFGYKGQERKPFDEAHLQWEKVHIGQFHLTEPTQTEEA